MKSLIHESASDKITDADVILNKAYPLVREMVYQYDVQVVGYTHMPHQDNMDVARLILAWKDIPVGFVFYDRNTAQFGFRNVMQRKERGKTHEDKYTYCATKVSALMRAIKKNKLMPESAHELMKIQYYRSFDRVPVAVSSEFKNVRKTVNLGGDGLHDLLNIAFNNRETHSLSQESIDKYKLLLDIYNDVDKVRAKQAEELTSIFSNPVWAIGYDKTGTFLTGKVRFDFARDEYYTIQEVTYSIVEPFERSRDVTHLVEVLPRLTMTKVHMQQHHESNVNAYGFVGESQLVPKRLDFYIPELHVVGGDSDTWGSLSDMRWMFVL